MTGSPQPESSPESHEEQSKRTAAEAALALVESGMILGLGTGSTAKYVTMGVARRLSDGSLERIRAVPTSRATMALAESLGIPLVELPAQGVDMAIDGMDEVDPSLNAIKGLGGALLREKVVASSAQLFVLIGDDRKTVARLGERSPVPVEVLPFGRARTIELLEGLSLAPALRMQQGQIFRTDNGNSIVDCSLSAERDPGVLAETLSQVPGVLEHGLFLGIADRAYIASGAEVRLMSRSDGA